MSVIGLPSEDGKEERNVEREEENGTYKQKYPYASVSSIMECVMLALVVPPGDVRSAMPIVMADDDYGVIRERLTRNVPSGALMACAELAVRQNGVYVHEFREFAKFDLPLSLTTVHGEEFELIGCIVTSKCHFQAYVMHSERKAGLEFNKQRLEHGVYRVDPMEFRQSPIAKRVGNVPMNVDELRAVLPKFTMTGFVPHLLVYVRVDKRLAYVTY